MIQASLKPGETIGIIAPSRPLFNIRQEVSDGLRRLEQLGFKLKLGPHIDERFYYSAGTVEQRLEDMHSMFRDPEVKAVVCATGGSSSNHLLPLLDYDLIANNPKILLGFSDITSLLLAIHSRTGLITYYGPTTYELGSLDKGAEDFLFSLLSGERHPAFPPISEIIRPGHAKGKLVGGILSRFNALLSTPYMPDLNGSILFWEETNVSPATIDFELQTLRLQGVFDKIQGMIIGHLSGCDDKKYPEDNRPIKDIVLERTAGYSFPIVQTECFGHDLTGFYTLPIGYTAELKSESRSLSLQ